MPGRPWSRRPGSRRAPWLGVPSRRPRGRGRPRRPPGTTTTVSARTSPSSRRTCSARAVGITIGCVWGGQLTHRSRGVSAISGSMAAALATRSRIRSDSEPGQLGRAQRHALLEPAGPGEVVVGGAVQQAGDERRVVPLARTRRGGPAAVVGSERRRHPAGGVAPRAEVLRERPVRAAGQVGMPADVERVVEQHRRDDPFVPSDREPVLERGDPGVDLESALLEPLLVDVGVEEAADPGTVVLAGGEEVGDRRVDVVGQRRLADLSGVEPRVRRAPEALGRSPEMRTPRRLDGGAGSTSSARPPSEVVDGAAMLASRTDGLPRCSRRDARPSEDHRA